MESNYPDMEKVFPTIKTKRLLLNEISQNDKEAVYELFADAEVVKYYDLDAFNDIEQAVKIIETFKARFIDSVGIRWAIRHPDNLRLLGTCGFNSYSFGRVASIGYDLATTYWGKGYATEVIGAMTRLAFNGGLPVKVNRIEALTIPGNIASERALEKNGFIYEGLLREKGYWKDRYHDMKIFSLLARERKQ